MKQATAVLVVTLLSCSPVLAQKTPEKARPKELEPLNHFVGQWSSDVTNKPAVWDKTGTKYVTENRGERLLDDWVLANTEVNRIVGAPEKVTKSLFLWTYDPATSKYVNWSIQSNGNMALSTGTWDDATKTFTLTSQEPPPNATGTFSEQFPDKDTIKGSLKFVAADRSTLMDMVWVRKRQPKETATDEQWKKIGTPIQPLPDELKKLQPFVGEWDAEFLQAPSVLFPDGGTSKGKVEYRWILDGRFLLGKSEMGQRKSLWVTGYDSAKKAYRTAAFSNMGPPVDSVGQWNETTHTLEMKGVNDPAGVKRTTTSRIVNNDTTQTRILIENAEGKTHVDLTIKSSRR